MTCYNPTVEGFKAQFPALPYVPEYISGQAYFKDDVVYYEPNFYQALKTTTNDPTNTNDWQLYNDSLLNYVNDDMISEAFGEAQTNFNPDLFPDCNTTIRIFYYLAAHYLVLDINNSITPFAMGFNGFTQSKSVGSVSESFGVPQWMLNDPVLSGYAQTGFGRKYLSLIKPYLVGNIIYTPGRVNFG